MPGFFLFNNEDNYNAMYETFVVKNLVIFGFRNFYMGDFFKEGVNGSKKSRII